MKVVIEREIFERVMYWVDKADKEVSGIGKAYYHDGNLVVYDAVISKCFNSSAQTEIDAHALGESMMKLEFGEGDYLWWWHSHVNMPVSFSPTDVNTTKELGKNGTCISTVFNKKRNFNSAVMHNFNVYADQDSESDWGFPPVYVDEGVMTEIGDYFDADTLEELDKDFKLNYKERPVTPAIRNKPYDNVYTYPREDNHDSMVMDFFLKDYPADIRNADWIEFSDMDYSPMVDVDKMGNKTKQKYVDMFADTYDRPPTSMHELESYIEGVLDDLFGKGEIIGV